MTGILNILAGSIASAIKDGYFNLTTLLLNGNGTNGAQNNTFLDSSSNNFTITRNGNTTQGTFSPFSQTGWSNFFDGTDDYLSIADNAVLRPGASNFTLEAWIWRGASGAAHTIYAKGGASTGIVFQVTSTNVLRFTHTTTNIDSTGTIAANAWTHVVVVREGTGTNQTKLYINGTQDGQGTVSTDFTQTEEVRIGTNRGATEDFNGYISNLRFVKGTALYTGAFTPSTTPLTTTSQGATATEVELLTCQDNRFLDNSSNAFTITVNGTPSVQAFSPFAPTAAYDAATVGGSGYFDGTGDFLTVPGSSALAFPGDFTIEGWVYDTDTASTTYGAVFELGTYTTDGIMLRMQPGSTTAAGLWVANVKVGALDTAFKLNKWDHWAIVRSGTATGNVKFYVNGALVLTSSTAITTSINASNAAMKIGEMAHSTSTANHFIGNIASIRIVKGQALTSGAFTPPTSPVTTSAVGWTGANAAGSLTGTVSLLLNFTNAGITDSTGKNVLETVGNAQISTTQSKFGGASISFDGTGDWLLLPHTVDQMLGTGAFTIEMWIYRNASGTYGLVGKGTGTTGWLVSLNSSNQVVFTYGSSTITSTGTISATTWTYIAVVREGTGTNQTKIYISGSNDGTGTVSTDFSQTNAMYVGADRTGGSAFNGYIDDLRITKGYARTIATPSSAFALQ